MFSLAAKKKDRFEAFLLLLCLDLLSSSAVCCVVRMKG